MRWLRLAGLFVALSFVAGAREARAQTGKITGTVTDAETGRPIEGAQVTLVGTGRGAITGSNGRYFIISVTPGTYAVQARRIGYQSEERSDVQVVIDVTRDVSFALRSSASTLAQVRVEAESDPIIQPGTTGSVSSITAAEIEAMPATNISGVLALQLGYLNVPVENTDVTAFVDERRGVTSVRIRGGRAGETMTMIDGIPINNFTLGGPAFDLTTEAVEQIGYIRGGMEAQYGNAMSGVINIATKEGTEDLRGSVSYQSSRFAGRLGSLRDSLLGRDVVQGRVSGPVPGFDGRVRWMFAGRQSTGAQRALEFDDQINNPFVNPADPRGNTAQAFDLFRGWRGVGFNQQRDLYGKLTTKFSPTTTLNVGAIAYEREFQDYNPAWVLTGYDMVDACRNAYPEAGDYCDRVYGLGSPQRWEDVIGAGASAFQTNKYSIQGSTRNTRSLLWASFNQTRGRTNYRLAAGRLNVARNACDWLTGVCLGDKIRNYTTAQSFVRGRFLSTSTVANAAWLNPGAGSENFAGGDTNTTHSLRADVESQVSDHHNIKGGIFFQQHDLRFYEAKNLSRPFDASVIGNYTYGGKPWDAAVYLQDNIEYDFVTIKLGMRFDYTRADGTFFTNPLDPTNGTTVTEVCNGTAFGNAPYSWTNTAGQTFTGIAACNLARTDSGVPFLMDSARRVAFQDDFSRAPTRRQFSPRIGVQFPLSERTSFFANWGIYSQNPIWNVMYQGTGIGRVADSTQFNPLYPSDTSRRIQRGQSLEGTPRGPNFRQDFGFVPLIGNPRLEIERSSQYEVGFLAEIGTKYGLRVTGFAKDQTGLTGFRKGGVLEDGTPVDDKGQTYNAAGTGIVYNVLVNTDFQTVRGVELIFNRKLTNFWAYDIRYGFQQIFTNAAPPELELQKQIERDLPVSREIRSEIDQPHKFTGVLRFQVDEQTPDLRVRGFDVGRLARNSRLTLTSNASSGLPYTPTISFGGLERLERNSGTAPATWQIDLYAEKKWRSGNLLYGAFVTVNNLTDRKNCLQPYTTTGQCDSGALTQIRGITGPFQNGGGVDPNAVGFQGVTTTQFDHPQLYGERRTILSGVRVSF